MTFIGTDLDPSRVAILNLCSLGFIRRPAAGRWVLSAMAGDVLVDEFDLRLSESDEVE